MGQLVGANSGVSRALFHPKDPAGPSQCRTARNESEPRAAVFGRGWSFEDLVLTPQWPFGSISPQWLVSLDHCDKRLTKVTDSARTDEWRERVRSCGADALVHVEAGIKIFALNKLLHEAGLALPTLGGANGQSLAGAISTGTHGGDIDQPPLADLVMAMHIVSVDGQEYWVERASSRITEDAALAFALDCADAVSWLGRTIMIIECREQSRDKESMRSGETTIVLLRPEKRVRLLAVQSQG